jgi:putative ABC transport system permease protein
MSTLLGDIRFSVRTLSKSPGFTLVSVLTMALGIGALSSIFSVVNAVLLRSLPYENASRLVLVDGVNAKEEGQRWPISYLDLTDWSRRQRSFEALAARTEARPLILRTSAGPELVDGEIVSSQYFRLLGVKPVLGRLFLPEDDAVPGTRRVALLGNDFWHSHFAAEPGVVGKVLEIEDVGYTVVGVLPAGFEGLTDQAKVFLPLSTAATLGADYTQERGFRWLYAVGRLKDGVTLDKAQKDLDSVGRQLASEFPDTNRNVGAKVTPLAEAWFGELRRKLVILLIGGFFLLLIVCTNLANLILARFVARRRDLSLRMALGARRSGLIRQILTESSLLALLGCGAGLLVARWSTGLLVRASGIPLKSFVNVDIDLVVVGVILTVSLLSGFVFGLVPALVLSSKLRLYEIFNEVGRRGMQGESHHRFQNTLIIGEVAVALLLLVCAGLMTKGFQRLARTDLGFKDQRVLTLRMSTKGHQYAEDPAVWNLVGDVQQKIGALPGVTSVALEGPGVPTDDWHGTNVLGAFVSLEDRPAEESPLLVVLHLVSPGYFRTLGVQLARGRDILTSDTAGTQKVGLVSESLAREYWKGQNPIGKRLKIGRRDKPNPNPWVTVVGVVSDIRHGGLAADERPAHNVYMALLQKVPRRPASLGLLVRTSVAPQSLVAEIQGRLHTIAPDLPVYDPATLEERLERQTAGNRSFVLLMSLFAVFALALAAVGVYGVVSYSVANRTQEIGVRMALGAQLRDVLRLVVGQGGRLALMGVALGLLLALVVTPVLTSWLYGVSPLDKVILGGMSALLLGVAMLASYIPARRAAKVAPFQALRLD